MVLNLVHTYLVFWALTETETGSDIFSAVPEIRRRGGGKSKAKEWEAKFKSRKCVCGDIQLFRECLYIFVGVCTTVRIQSQSFRHEIGQRIQKNTRHFRSIKKVTDTNILDGITKASMEKAQAQAQAQSINAETAELPSSLTFGNMAIVSRNILHKRVIYNSGFDQPMTYDKSRFVSEPTPASSDIWVETPAGEMLVECYGRVLVKGTSDGKTRDLLFKRTAYTSKSDISLVSVVKLMDERFV